MRRIILLLAFLAFGFLTPCVLADEGMWLFNQPPRQLLKKTFGFDLTDAWLENAQKASIRFNNGGSGSFVSPDGLCVTNHHIGADSLQKLSSKDKNLFRDGFYARRQADELKCPDLELNVLESIADVTKEVTAAVDPKAGAAESELARRAVIARITKESREKTGLRSDVVTLYNGGLYHLYRYKKYTDVRLVMAPEHDIAFFGGDTDNFEYPRYNLDICFFRAYENDKPAKTPHFFPWSKTGPSEGELVFVSGHPGTTNRLETYEHTRHRLYHLLPYQLNLMRAREALLLQYAEKGPEQRRQADKDLYPVANARKALSGQFHGLLDRSLLDAKRRAEIDLSEAYDRDPIKLKQAPNPWASVNRSLGLGGLERLYFLVERGDAFDSRLFRIARTLVRLAAELPKEDGKRLPEYRSSALESLKFQLFSPAAISRDLERVKLAGSLAFFAEHQGTFSDIWPRVLDGKTPARRAAQLVEGTKLDDVAERQRYFAEGQKAIDASIDSMIVVAKEIDEQCRRLRDHWDQDQEKLKQAYAVIHRERFAKYGASVAPDATFTLRLAFGVVKGYEEDGQKVPFTTTFAGAFARAADHENREPFRLPSRWLGAKEKLDLKTPFNFASTADTIGGNSGSPVLNRKGELVGINFDRNRHGLVRNFIYTEEQARHISVHSRGVLEALHVLYDAGPLLKELLGH